jgi:hypothetical protein
MSRTGRIARCLGVALGVSAIACDANASMGSLAPRSPGTAGNAQQEWVVDPNTNCRALDSVRWQGACVGGMVSGPGTLSFLNGGRALETITGTFGGGALLPSHVSASWSDGSKYDGDQNNGQFEGMGSFVSATGDKINGEWKAGALNGTATVIWKNGDRYDGEWKDGKSDGEGTEIWANGDRFEGLWKAGSPVRQNTTASQTPSPGGSSVTTAPAAPPTNLARTIDESRPAPAAQIAAATSAAKDTPSQVTAPVLPLHSLVGKTLIAVDGSTIDLNQSEGGLTRIVTLPDGTTQQTAFAFMSDRIGTVSNETAAVGLFRAKGDEIDTNYVDGTTEVMKPGTASGLVLVSRDSNGNSACTAWYPEGHVFSQDEKKAAVEEYATRLGISQQPSTKKRRPTHAGTQTCGGGFVTNIATNGASTSQPPSLQPLASQSQIPAESSPSTNAKPADALQAIPVKDSPVHLIDAPFEPAAAPQAIQDVTFGTRSTTSQSPAAVSVPQAARAVSNAAECLSVANNGEYWGFQNRCSTVVQFAYCEMSNANPLTSCHSTSVSGSVAANGFSALVNASSLSLQGVNHEFRWMACDGGAGEVVPHLDSVDPPSGRCLRAVPVDSGTIPNPAGS